MRPSSSLTFQEQLQRARQSSILCTFENVQSRNSAVVPTTFVSAHLISTLRFTFHLLYRSGSFEQSATRIDKIDRRIDKARKKRKKKKKELEGINDCSEKNERLCLEKGNDALINVDETTRTTSSPYPAFRHSVRPPPRMTCKLY